MCDLVARTGRHQQRYKDGYRLVAGCIPFKYESCDDDDNRGTEKKITKVLMISSQNGPGHLFPKGGWENDETVEEAAVREAIEEAGVRGDLKEYLGDYDFSSKSHQDEFCPEGLCKASMFSLHVNEELSSWPEKSTRRREWLTIPEAAQKCQRPWMQRAFHTFLQYYDNANNSNDDEDDSKIAAEEEDPPASLKSCSPTR